MNAFLRALAVELKPFSTANIARRAKTTERAVENWRQARNGPTWQPVATMLNDPVLRPAILAAAKRVNGQGGIRKHKSKGKL